MVVNGKILVRVMLMCYGDVFHKWLELKKMRVNDVAQTLYFEPIISYTNVTIRAIFASIPLGCLLHLVLLTEIHTSKYGVSVSMWAVDVRRLKLLLLPYNRHVLSLTLPLPWDSTWPCLTLEEDFQANSLHQFHSVQYVLLSFTCRWGWLLK